MRPSPFFPLQETSAVNAAHTNKSAAVILAFFTIFQSLLNAKHNSIIDDIAFKVNIHFLAAQSVLYYECAIIFMERYG